MTHRDRVGDPPGRRQAAGDVGHRQGFPTRPPSDRPRRLYGSLSALLGIRYRTVQALPRRERPNLSIIRVAAYSDTAEKTGTVTRSLVGAFPPATAPKPALAMPTHRSIASTMSRSSISSS